MVDQSDQEQKTEKPTEYALKRSREKGQVAQSRELYHTLVLASFAIFLSFMAAPRGHAFLFWVRVILDTAAQRTLDGKTCIQLLQQVLENGMYVVAPFFAILVCAVVAGLGVQTRFRLNRKLFEQPLARLSLMKGIKRVFSRQQVVEFCKSALKVTVVLTFASILIFQHVPILLSAVGADLRSFLTLSAVVVGRFIAWIIVGVLVLALLDYGYQWFTMFRKLFMSKDDIKRENKEHQGDPQTLSHRRRVQKEVAQMRHAAKQIASANVVITNPDHYAVALEWVAYKMMAPTVLCKGKGRLALYIKRLAAERGIPVMENPPLARSLYQGVTVGTEIHPEHYKAVASIIQYVLTRDRQHSLQ